ncbi:uncharacterized protein C8R40DRAFT_1241159 [Lentinula edodes]|uniref:uncharacterized protein n=1 Tax=Lentinula edodes TaxID=5353 RepID=UPI001E8E9DC1|nr:uncharacterized protein C8R40DRAFT_1241159 [Lentinula edodes]KAH7869373.1 hypothetical protein C8R40DRAFT_1241159 [Lentinula edodes]
MPPPSRKRRLSDIAYKPSGSVRKRLRRNIPSPPPNLVAPSSQEDINSDSDVSPLEIPVSSAPASPRFDHDGDNVPLSPLDLQPYIVPPVTPTHAKSRNQLQTPMTVLLSSPAQLYGRPRIRRSHHNPLANSELRASPIQWEDKQAEIRMKRAATEAVQDLNTKQLEREEVNKAHHLFNSITQPKEEGGLGFRSMKHFADRLFGTDKTVPTGQ